jgi:hypothetical protein
LRKEVIISKIYIREGGYMNNYNLGIIICLISTYASLSIGIAIKLHSMKQPLIAAICIAPLVPINSVLMNLIVGIGSEYTRKYTLTVRIIKALKMTFGNYSYYLGLSCHVITSSKLSFRKFLRMPILLIFIGIIINKDYLKQKYLKETNKKQNIDLYTMYTNQIRYNLVNA